MTRFGPLFFIAFTIALHLLASACADVSNEGQKRVEILPGTTDRLSSIYTPGEIVRITAVTSNAASSQ